MQTVNETSTPTTPKKTEQIMVKVTPTLASRFKEAAQRQGLSPQEAIRCFMASYAQSNTQAQPLPN